jgi:hypothetical protein
MEIIMSTDTQVAQELLGEIDEKVKLIEDTKLGWWSRFKRRYFNWKGIIVWNVSGNFTLLQVFGFKKFAAWFVIKFPTAASLLGKIWAGVTAFFVGAYEVLVP